MQMQHRPTAQQTTTCSLQNQPFQPPSSSLIATALRRGLIRWRTCTDILLLLFVVKLASFPKASGAHPAYTVPCRSTALDYCQSGSEDPVLKANNVTLIPFDVTNPHCQKYISNGKYDLVGSQMSGRLSVYAFVRSQNVRSHHQLQYVHVPVEWHPKVCCSHIKPKEYRKVEDLFNLGAEELSYDHSAVRNKVVCVAFNCDANEQSVGTGRMWGPALLDMRRKYWSALVDKPHLPLFKTDHVNVVVHIRRGDVDAQQADRWTELDHYLPWLKMLKDTLQDIHQLKLAIIIMSEGKPEDFTPLTKAHPDLILNLGDSRVASMHAMVAADVLFMAKSTFSGVPALYNEGIVVVQPWAGGAQPSWIKTDNFADMQAQFASPKTRQLLRNRLRMRTVGF